MPDRFNNKFCWPVFNIKLQDSPEKGSSQKLSKETITKLILSKYIILAHVHIMIDEVIEMIYDIKTANISMRKVKKAFALFDATMFTLPEQHAAPFNLITIPGPYFIFDTNSLQNLVLELIRNLQLGDYKNVNEAKCRLTLDCMLSTNFGRHDLFHVIKLLTAK